MILPYTEIEALWKSLVQCMSQLGNLWLKYKEVRVRNVARRKDYVIMDFVVNAFIVITFEKSR